jgi:hypothetical protein
MEEGECLKVGDRSKAGTGYNEQGIKDPWTELVTSLVRFDYKRPKR